MSSITIPTADEVPTHTAAYRGRLLRYANVDGAVWWAVPDIGAALALSRADGSLSYRLGKLPATERRLLPLSTGCGVRKVGALSQSAAMRLAADLETRAAKHLLRWLTKEVRSVAEAAEAAAHEAMSQALKG